MAAFIQLHTSVTVAARDTRNRPELARGSGCRVSSDRRRLIVFLCPERASRVLSCLRDNGAIAVAITRPSTHEAVQIKGTVAEITPMTDADRAIMAAYRDAFVEEIVPLGYAPGFARDIIPFGGHCLAVSVVPTAVFDQTPGPRAGAPRTTWP